MKKIFIKKPIKKIKVFLTYPKKMLTINGPLGTIDYIFNNLFTFDNKLFIRANDLSFFVKKIKSLINSVTVGWFLELNLNGIGYKSFKLKDKFALDVGYSNLIIYKPNDNLKIKNLKNKIILFSLNQVYLKDVGTKLKKFAFPDLYKGKGIVYKNEIIKLKKKNKS